MTLKCPKCKAKLKDHHSHFHCNRCGYDGPKTKSEGLKSALNCPKCGSSFITELIGGLERYVCDYCKHQFNKGEAIKR